MKAPRLTWAGSRAAQQEADEAWQSVRRASAARKSSKQRRGRSRKPKAKRRDYAAYLRSAGWRDRRQKAIEAAGGRYATCGSSERLEVHHLHYRTVGRERTQDLLVPCHECHSIEHEAKGAADEMTRRFVEIARSF